MVREGGDWRVPIGSFVHWDGDEMADVKEEGCPNEV